MVDVNCHRAMAGVSALLIGFAGALSAQEQPSPAAKAYDLRMSGKLKQGKELLEQHLSADPKDAQAWFELARLHFQQSGATHNLDQAQRAIGRAVAAEANNNRHQYLAALIAVYNSVLKAHHHDPEGRKKQLAVAAKAAEQAIALDPGDHETRLLLVAVYGNNPPALGGDRQRAEQHVQFLEKHSPLHGVEARCDFSFPGRIDKQFELWNELADQRPNEPKVHRRLAKLYAQKGDPAQAGAHLEKALTLAPADGTVLLEVASEFARNKRLEVSEQLLQRYLAFDPPQALARRAWATMALGQVQKLQGKQDLAAQTLAEARRLDPDCWFTAAPPPEALFNSP